MLIGHCNAKETMTQKIILKVKDLMGMDLLRRLLFKREFEIRLYIDAPEISYCNKIKKR
jgi:hypothetical protein